MIIDLGHREHEIRMPRIWQMTREVLDGRMSYDDFMFRLFVPVERMRSTHWVSPYGPRQEGP